MTIPTRIIEDDEFASLIRLESGDVIPRWVLTPYYYEEEMGKGISMNRGPGVYLLFLNVVDPVLYKDRGAGVSMIIANKHANWGYTDIEDLHPRRNADLYVLCPDGWDVQDPEHDLDDAVFWFKLQTAELPEISIEKGSVLPVDERGEAH